MVADVQVSVVVGKEHILAQWLSFLVIARIMMMKEEVEELRSSPERRSERVVVRVLQEVVLQAWTKWTYCCLHCLLVGPGAAEMGAPGLGMRLAVLPTPVGVWEAEDHRDVMAVVKLAAEVKMVEAYFDLLVYHDPLKKHSGVLNGLDLTSEDLLERSSAAYCNMEDLTVFDYALHTRARLVEDARLEGTALGSRKGGKGFVHMVTRYSARRAAAAVVLDP